MSKPRIRMLVSVATGEVWAAPLADQNWSGTSDAVPVRKRAPRGGSRPSWSKAEDAILAEHYSDGGTGACAPLLPKRTIHAIRMRAAGLRIVCGKGFAREHNWSDQELADLRKLYPIGGAKAVAPHVPTRSRACIIKKANTLGIHCGRGQRKIDTLKPATLPVAGPTGGGDARETVPPPKPAKRNGPMSFEEQMEAVANGARLVAVVPFRRADPAYSLGGTVGEIL